MSVKPLEHKPIIKKRTKKFARFHSERFVRVKAAWRKPRGIDSPMRRQYSGQRPMVSIGYGSDKETRHMLPCGFYKMRIYNVAQLDALLTNNQKYAAEIAHGVSAKTRKIIIAKAAEMGVKVLNAKSRMRMEEK